MRARPGHAANSHVQRVYCLPCPTGQPTHFNPRRHRQPGAMGAAYKCPLPRRNVAGLPPVAESGVLRSRAAAAVVALVARRVTSLTALIPFMRPHSFNFHHHQHNHTFIKNCPCSPSQLQIRQQISSYCDDERQPQQSPNQRHTRITRQSAAPSTPPAFRSSAGAALRCWCRSCATRSHDTHACIAICSSKQQQHKHPAAAAAAL